MVGVCLMTGTSAGMRMEGVAVTVEGTEVNERVHNLLDNTAAAAGKKKG